MLKIKASGEIHQLVIISPQFVRLNLNLNLNLDPNPNPNSIDRLIRQSINQYSFYRTDWLAISISISQFS